MYFGKNNPQKNKWTKHFYKKVSIYVTSIVLLFIFIGLLTTIKPAYRFSSAAITKWTSDIDSSTFLYLIETENKALGTAFPKDRAVPSVSTIFFQIATNLKMDDLKSLLGREVPGFFSFGNRIIVAGEGTSYENLSIESSPPLEEVLKERKAILDEPEEKLDQQEDETKKELFHEDVVLLYNTHNYESFLPYLPSASDANSAYHDEVNITMVSDRLSDALNNYGIGTKVDKTDIMQILNEKDWEFNKSYKASRPVVEEALAANKDIQYVFDIHRDALPKDKSTKEINGKTYAKSLIIVGAEYSSYEKNLALATELHYLIEESYPGLSRGVLTKEGAGTNGVFNQDLSENSLLFEFGGYENTLDELYRTADAIAKVFSEFYWDAEKIDAN